MCTWERAVTIREAIGAIVGGRDLSQAEAASVMEEIMTGEASAAQIGAFLTALHIKGETDAEIAGMAEVMRQKATPVYVDGPVADTCGTGGDGSHTFNISTAAAFVAAGAGLVVAKHGNRAMSSVCGSADVLEGLGVKIDLDADGVARCLREAGIGFMFAQKFHPAMRFAGPVRREIGIRTAFNILGPLTNPARARHQVLGVASAPLAEKLARALSRLDTAHALVVHGDGGVDELSLSGPNQIYDVRAGQQPRQFTVAPEDLGLRRASQEALKGGDVALNTAIVRGVLAGEDTGPRRDVVLLNAAAALVAGDKAADLAAGLVLARASIDEGRAMARLDSLIAVSNA
jgi:anthranilate phosphoribosyltransferase